MGGEIHSPGIHTPASNADGVRAAVYRMAKSHAFGGGGDAGPGIRCYKVTAIKKGTTTLAAWTDWPTDEVYPTLCEANPCRAGGTRVDTSITKRIVLNTKADAPNGIITAVDQIIAAVPLDGSLYYNTSGTAVVADAMAMLGFGCWMDWSRWRAV